MTTKPTSSRSELVRQRRSSQKRTTQTSRQTTSSARQAYRPESVYLPVEPRRLAPRTHRQAQGSTLRSPSKSKQARGSTSNRMTKNPRRNGYDFAFSLGRADVRAPALSMPQLGPRWVSAALTLLLGFLLYTLWTASTFTVAAAEVRGNQRLGSEEVYAMLGMAGQPIFKAVPAQIETNLRTAFPDLASVRVHIGLPNHIIVDVVERMPILVWYEGGAVTWIDANGVAFMPRGDVQGLIQVASNGAPPKVPSDPTKLLYDQSFIAPEMVKAMVALSPHLPAGVSMTYDPHYGMGWQDPRGWSVYFGQNTQDIPMKLEVYQTIVDTFTRQGIQPTLISVEYLDAPFYK